MKLVTANGMNMKNPLAIKQITIRTETTGNHKTLSLSDDKTGEMLMIVITPEVEKLLKGL